MNDSPEHSPTAINWRFVPVSAVILAAGLYAGFYLQQGGALQQSVSMRWEEGPVLQPEAEPAPALAATDPQPEQPEVRQVSADAKSSAEQADPQPVATVSETVLVAESEAPDARSDTTGAKVVGGRTTANRKIDPTVEVAIPVQTPTPVPKASNGRGDRVVNAEPAGSDPQHADDRLVRKTNHDTLLSSWNTLSRELADAVDGSSGDRVRALVAAGTDINASDIRGETPLIKAAWNSDAAMVRTLLELGADVYLATNDGRTALYTGVVSGNPDVVNLLLEAGAPPNAITDFGKTPLMASAWIEHPDIAVQLLRYGAEPNQRDTRGRGALFYALWDSNVNVARILAANGARLDQSDYLGQTAADIARLRRIDLNDVASARSRVN